jgi:hypothetical protein
MHNPAPPHQTPPGSPRRPGRRRLTCLLIAVLIFPACIMLYYLTRPLPIEQERQLYPGVTYFRSVRLRTNEGLIPSPVILHAIRIDLKTPGLEFLVTPGDRSAEQPLEARTVSSFLQKYNLQVAVNGDGFTPWRSNSPLDFYPHSGDPVTPLGFAASQGVDYAKGVEDEVTLYISKDNEVSFNNPHGGVYNAISGDRIVLARGDIPNNLPADDSRQPRTAIGIDREGDTLLILVADGRQPFYSEGVTLRELGEILAGYGMHTALNLDGGGSSTLVVEGFLGFANVLNSPADRSIPGLQRPVGNHLGVWVGRSENGSANHR